MLFTTPESQAGVFPPLLDPLDASQVISFQFKGLTKARLSHAVLTRHGGVSRPPYNSLNTSQASGDRPEDVAKNLRVVVEVIGADHLVSMKQCHGSHVEIIQDDGVESLSRPIYADALITNRKRIAIMVRLADCQGIILFDPVKKVLANVHCGWRGNVLNIIDTTVRRMVSTCGCRARDVMAAVGPSLGPCCAEFRSYEQIFPREFRAFMVGKNTFDLWAISRWQLRNAGLKDRNIEVAGVCTRCRTDLFYSYRGEGVTGRFAMVAMLQ